MKKLRSDKRFTFPQLLAFVSVCLLSGLICHADSESGKTAVSGKTSLPNNADLVPELENAVVPVAPVNVVQGGFVLLDLSVNSAGDVTRVQTLEGKDPFLSCALESARLWNFKTNLTQGSTHVSALFFFRAPQSFSFQNTETDHSQQASLRLDCPPLPRSISFFAYPPNSIAQGVVMIQTFVGTQGEVERIHLVHDVSSLSESVIQTVRSWKFFPARSNGTARAGTAIITVSFQRPVISGTRPSSSP